MPVASIPLAWDKRKNPTLADFGRELDFSTAHGPTFYFSVCLLIILKTVSLILLTVIIHVTGHDTDSL